MKVLTEPTDSSVDELITERTVVGESVEESRSLEVSPDPSSLSLHLPASVK